MLLQTVIEEERDSKTRATWSSSCETGKEQTYAEILKDLKMNIKPNTIGGKIKGIRQTWSGGVLIMVRSEAEGRWKLTPAIKEAVGRRENVRKLVPHTEVEILGFD